MTYKKLFTKLAGSDNKGVISTSIAPATQSTLLPHQSRIVRRITDPETKGLLLWHGLGSGKTRSSIEALKALKPETASVVVPAALMDNYKKELDKWYPDYKKNTKLDLISQQNLAKSDDASLSKDLIIVDEAHRARNLKSKLFKNLLNATKDAKKVLLLSGTPVYNNPSDLTSPISLIQGERKGVTGNTRGFEHNFLSDSILNNKRVLKNKAQLQEILSKYVDYYGGSKTNFPDVSNEAYRVPMTARQKELFVAAISKMDPRTKLILQSQLRPGKRDLSKLLPFFSGLRALANTNAGMELNPLLEDDPKIDKAFNLLTKGLKKDPNFKAIVYSNYLNSGIHAYAKHLKENKIPYGEFSGVMNKNVRDDLVKQYNKNKLKVLLLSSAGGEGLDLKNTKLVQILEPHYNNEKLDQVIGRAIRYKSHEGLPPEERKVTIQQFLADAGMDRRGRPIKSVDDWLYDMSQRKTELNKQVKELAAKMREPTFREKLKYMLI